MVLIECWSYFLIGMCNNLVMNVDIVGVIDEIVKDMMIDCLQQYNVFGEVLVECDGCGNWMILLYNMMGYLKFKYELKVSVMFVNGVQVEVELDMCFYYDFIGNLVGLKDVNGNLIIQQWNYGFVKVMVVWIWDVLGFSKVMQYDVFGNL